MSKERFTLMPAVFLVLRRGNEVLLLRRAGVRYQSGKYSLIAGHMDGDELATDAAVREAKEEAGITVDPRKLTFVHVTHRLTRDDPGQERIDLFFEVREWEGEITNMEPEKCSDLTWYPLDALPEDIIPIVRMTLEYIARGVPYSEYEEEPAE